MRRPLAAFLAAYSGRSCMMQLRWPRRGGSSGSASPGRRQDACHTGRRRTVDTPGTYVLLTCPGLMGVRLRIPAIGSILPTPDEVRRSDVVAALVTAFRAL